MKIKEVSFKNKAHRWELEKTEFSDLTLLVGASGVGKTQILNSIVKLINISNGYAYNGVEWDLHFITLENKHYRWTGEFETLKGVEQQEFEEEDIPRSESLKQIPRLLNEKLFLENKLVFERKESRVKYEGKDVPKISPHKSVLNLFTTEDKILPVKMSFERVLFLDYNREKKVRIDDKFITKFKNSFEKDSHIFKELEEELKPILEKELPMEERSEILKNDKLLSFMFTWAVNFPIMPKLAIVYQYFRGHFDEIVNDFRDIFPQVEDVRFKLLEKEDVYELQIKEQDTDWISRNEISSGMFKTLLHIAEMKLMAIGYVILIDEFENSLGVNCIDAVAGDLAEHQKNLQYIITSHHPYIINNIDMKYWKVVMRKGAKVFTKNADQLKLGKSKHEAFKQLLNLEEFAEGIS